MEDKEKFVHQLMRDSLLKMPFSDFEDQVMLKIEKQEQLAIAALTDRKKGIFFFLIGMICGLTINYLMTRYLLDLNLNPIHKDNLLLTSQIVYALLILFFFERIVKLFQLSRLSKKTGS